jgi:NADPH:quinone reductase-like Zn-dependent oxidoreductase
MKAVIYTQYGSPDVLQVAEAPQPTPKDNEVLIKIRAVSINAADLHLMRADPFPIRFAFGLFKPKLQILGADVAGQVETTGKNVAQFKVGDEVFGDLSGVGFGGLAEYVCAPESVLAFKPANLTFEETAALPMASITALQGLRDVGNIKAGQKVLIYGASGGVGTFAVQIAKLFGAEVTAVCSTSKIDQARSLGADHVFDYTRQDFAQITQRYDLIFIANGNRQLADYERALTPTGTYVLSGGAFSQLFQAMLLGPLRSKAGGKSIKTFVAKPNQSDLNIMKELVESGKVKPAIDKCYPLSEASAAMHYLEEGHARGKIIIML